MNDSSFCYPGMKGGVYISDTKEFKKGHTIELHPFIEPWFLVEYDSPKIIPKFYLFEYTAQDSSFSCIDSILYVNSNRFNYSIKNDGYSELFGTIFLDNEPVFFSILLSTDEEKYMITEQKKNKTLLRLETFKSYIKKTGKNFIR
jgi:hypothetical protein